MVLFWKVTVSGNSRKFFCSLPSSNMGPGKDKNKSVMVQKSKPSPSRQLRSLAELTRKFVQLLQEGGNTALDLRYVGELLSHELWFLTFLHRTLGFVYNIIILGFKSFTSLYFATQFVCFYKYTNLKQQEKQIKSFWSLFLCCISWVTVLNKILNRKPLIMVVKYWWSIYLFIFWWGVGDVISGFRDSGL